MSDTRDTIPSVVDRIRPIDTGAMAVVAAHFLGQTAVLALGEAALLMVAGDGAVRRVEVHDGAILATACDGERVLTGGDDGKVVATDADGDSTVVATDGKRRWIDHVALGPSGAAAWSAGKAAHVQTAKGMRSLELPSTPGGLAFMPKGLRLAIAHYNGVTLWFANAETAPETLAWKGSHLGVTASPDGRFLVTSMQEAALHGWRLADRKDMRMSGYSARVRSVDWTEGGKWLATSGSNQLILWPFHSKDGPMGKTPRILAPAEAQAEVVACHPQQEIAAVGFADGMVLIVRIEDGAEVLARRPGGAPVTALAWSAGGKLLAFGTEDGDAGLVPLG
jgi:WD40 repeat protein